MKQKSKDEEPIKDVVLHVLRYDIWLKILTVVAMCLIIAGFCVPPTGIIDGSVLIATGILAGFGAMFEAGHAIDKGLDTKLKIKGVELSIDNKGNDDKGNIEDSPHEDINIPYNED